MTPKQKYPGTTPNNNNENIEQEIEQQMDQMEKEEFEQELMKEVDRPHTIENMIEDELVNPLYAPGELVVSKTSQGLAENLAKLGVFNYGNYMGPNWFAGERGDTYKNVKISELPKPINAIDFFAMLHDIDYIRAKDGKDITVADQKFVDRLFGIKDGLLFLPARLLGYVMEKKIAHESGIDTCEQCVKHKSDKQTMVTTAEQLLHLIEKNLIDDVNSVNSSFETYIQKKKGKDFIKQDLIAKLGRRNLDALRLIRLIMGGVERNPGPIERLTTRNHLYSQLGSRHMKLRIFVEDNELQDSNFFTRTNAIFGDLALIESGCKMDEKEIFKWLNENQWYTPNGYTGVNEIDVAIDGLNAQLYIDSMWLQKTVSVKTSLQVNTGKTVNKHVYHYTFYVYLKKGLFNYANQFALPYLISGRYVRCTETKTPYDSNTKDRYLIRRDQICKTQKEKDEKQVVGEIMKRLATVEKNPGPMSLQLTRTLLLIGGVEQNPGPEEILQALKKELETQADNTYNDQNLDDRIRLRNKKIVWSVDSDGTNNNRMMIVNDWEYMSKSFITGNLTTITLFPRAGQKVIRKTKPTEEVNLIGWTPEVMSAYLGNTGPLANFQKMSQQQIFTMLANMIPGMTVLSNPAPQKLATNALPLAKLLSYATQDLVSLDKHQFKNIANANPVLPSVAMARSYEVVGNFPTYGISAERFLRNYMKSGQFAKDVDSGRYAIVVVSNASGLSAKSMSGLVLSEMTFPYLADPRAVSIIDNGGTVRDQYSFRSHLMNWEHRVGCTDILFVVTGVNSDSFSIPLTLTNAGAVVNVTEVNAPPNTDIATLSAGNFVGTDANTHDFLRAYNYLKQIYNSVAAEKEVFMFLSLMMMQQNEYTVNWTEAISESYYVSGANQDLVWRDGAVDFVASIERLNYNYNRWNWLGMAPSFAIETGNVYALGSCDVFQKLFLQLGNAQYVNRLVVMPSNSPIPSIVKLYKVTSFGLTYGQRWLLNFPWIPKRWLSFDNLTVATQAKQKFLDAHLKWTKYVQDYIGVDIVSQIVRNGVQGISFPWFWNPCVWSDSALKELDYNKMVTRDDVKKDGTDYVFKNLNTNGKNLHPIMFSTNTMDNGNFFAKGTAVTYNVTWQKWYQSSGTLRLPCAHIFAPNNNPIGAGTGFPTPSDSYFAFANSYSQMDLDESFVYYGPIGVINNLTALGRNKLLMAPGNVVFDTYTSDICVTDDFGSFVPSEGKKEEESDKQTKN